MKRKIAWMVIIASLLGIKTYISYDLELRPYVSRIKVMDNNINNGMKAMKELANGYKDSNEVEKVAVNKDDDIKNISGEILMHWKQRHRDGLLYSYNDSQLDFDGTGLSDGDDITNLALVKLNTYDNITSITGAGIKAYTLIKDNSKYTSYKLALISYSNSVDNLEIDGVDLTSDNSSIAGVTIDNNIAYIEQGLVDGVSRIEYDNGNEKVYLNYTFDIFGNKDDIKNLPNGFNIDLIYKGNGLSYSDKMEAITYKFDNSKYLTDNKDYVQLSLTISLAFDPEYLNTLLGDNSINFKSIGYAHSSFSDLFVFRVNNKFDINLK